MTPPHKAGFAAIIGRPNAGKSTLFNSLLKRKLSIVSKQPQTTRHNILGILNAENYQLCFLDTPGLLDAAKDGLQGALIRSAMAASREDCDVLVLLVEPVVPSPEAVAALGRAAAAQQAARKPVFVAVNKSDTVKEPARLQEVAAAYAEALNPAETHVISSLYGRGVAHLIDSIAARLPDSPPYYPKDQLSDRWERFFAAEIVREKVFESFHDEVPHACAVVIESFKEKPGGPDRISAEIHVERPTQKGILIGAKGKAIRGLTAESGKSLEAFLGRKVALELRVKVSPNWRKDAQALKRFGYIP